MPLFSRTSFSLKLLKIKELYLFLGQLEREPRGEVSPPQMGKGQIVAP